jgi:alpha-glucosidase
VTKLGRPYTGFRQREIDDIQPSDIALGTRRARAAALLTLGLPGGAFLYQGEELGLWEVEDLPEASLQDPIWERTHHQLRGRDGCRVPIPWSGDAPPFGFGPPGSSPWLPQPVAWRDHTVAAEDRDPGSTLALYRAALRLRREHAGFRSTSLRWHEARSALVFERGHGLVVAVNFGPAPLDLPGGARVLLSSATLEAGRLPVDAAAWLELG